MPVDAIVGIIVFSSIFFLEFLFPYFPYKNSRVRHALTNGSLVMINTILSVFFSALILTSLNQLKNPQWEGVLAPFQIFPWLKIILSVIVFDAWMYLWHRMNHEVYFLWRFHRVHHTDPAMDSTTAVRFHPIEIFFSSLIRVPVMLFIGLSVQDLVIYSSFSLPIIVLHHSNINLPEIWDKRLRSYIVMPRMHRVHHSEVYEETNSNYGSIFSFWDRFFKSYKIREDMLSVVYGIGTFKREKWQNIRGLLRVPFQK